YVYNAALEVHTEFDFSGIASWENVLTIHSTPPAGPTELNVDALVPATGFRPDLDILSELRLELYPAVEAPRQLGPLIDPEFHSCGSVQPHRDRMLAHP